MLVLSRRRLESVVVSAVDAEPMLKVTVLQIIGPNVRLGFEAGKEVAVHRWEVWERIQAGSQKDSPSEDPAAPVG
jgi:carbon storage regulator